MSKHLDLYVDESRTSYYNNENYSYSENEDSDNIDIENEQDYGNTLSKIDDTANTIRANILTYVKDKGYSLCEFLNIENVRNFTIYLTNKK